MATAAALKKTVILRLQNLHDETNASTAERMIANSPPYNSSVRKINVSETATCDLNLGIGIVTREPIATVNTHSTGR